MSLISLLRLRNYRLFFGGQIISLTGTWMTTTAMSWLIFDLSGSALWLGWLGFANQAPMLVLAPLAGVWVDRWDRLSVVRFAQALSLLKSVALAYLTFSGNITIPALLALAAFQGCVNAFDMPARQSLPIQLVAHRDQLPAAIALNSSVFNLARLCGPAFAGLIIAQGGPAHCFLIDALSYIPVLIALGMVRLPAHVPLPRSNSMWTELRAGIRYTWRHPLLRATVLMAFALSTFGFSYNILLPVFAERLFQGDARTLGLLMSTNAAGALCGALYLAHRTGGPHGVAHMPVASALFGTAIAGFALAPTLPLALPFLVLSGFGGIIVAASNHTLIQTLVEETMRGRVTSLYGMAFLGGMPLGALLFGALAEWWHPRPATCLAALTGLTLAGVAYRLGQIASARGEDVRPPLA